MKHLKFLFLFIGLAILASCSDTDVNGGLIADKNQANFSGKIGELQTRVTDNSWENGDAIGIYALNAGAELSEAAIFDGKSNVKYSTDAEGNFTAAAAAPINFPNDGDLDFVAYYPYTSPITDYKYSIDVTTQSDFAAIDLLYSDNAKQHNKANPNVDLVFNHMLSKLVLNIKLDDNLTSLQGLTASINNVVVDGNLALADGVVTTGTTRKDITPHVAVASGNETATVSAIVVPGQNLEDATIVFSLGGKDYKWIPTTQELESKYKYTYIIKLTLDESGEPIVVPVKIGATINDWNDPQIGDTPIVLDPEKEGEDPVTPGEGDGSKENPYTVAQVMALYVDGEVIKDVWVKGFIVGTSNSGGDFVPIFSTDNASGTNLVFADSKDETDETKVIPVAIKFGGAARADLNLVSNPDMYKAEVLLKGDIIKYFGLAGLKEVVEYELVTPGEGGDTPTPVEFTADKSAVVFNAESELTSTVKLTTDAAQAWTVASDASWLTVAPASGSGNADIALTAEEYTEETARTTTVTITPTDNADLTAIVVTVTQNGKPAAGGDFATDLFFSEYVEGSSSNKYLEIYNGTGATVDLTDYEVVLYSNGATERGNNIQLTGTLAQGAVFVIANAGGDIYTGADVTSTVTYFNGDDAVALQRISTGDYVDIIGRIGERPDKKWSAGGDLETLDKTLVRKPSVKGGVTVNPSEGFPTLATEWIGHPQDYHELGSHTTDY